jgi:hypothetical protein
VLRQEARFSVEQAGIARAIELATALKQEEEQAKTSPGQAPGAPAPGTRPDSAGGARPPATPGQ